MVISCDGFEDRSCYSCRWFKGDGGIFARPPDIITTQSIVINNGLYHLNPQDNVNVFLKACGKLGLNVSQLFDPGDLQDLSTRATLRYSCP